MGREAPRREITQKERKEVYDAKAKVKRRHREPDTTQQDCLIKIPIGHRATGRDTPKRKEGLWENSKKVGTKGKKKGEAEDGTMAAWERTGGGHSLCEGL